MNDRGQIVAHALRAGFTGHQIIILTPPPSPGSVAGSGFGEGQPGIGLSGWTPWSPYIPPDRPRVRPWPMPPQDPEDPQLSPNGVARFDQGTPAAITQHADMPTGGGLIRLRYLFLDAGTHEPGNPARVQLLIDGHIIATAVAPETPADTFADLVGQVPQNFAGVNGALLEIRVTGPQDLDLLIDDVEFVLAVSNPQDATRCPGESVEFTLDLAIGQAASFEWFLNGSPIDDQTNPSAATSTLILTDLQPIDAGQYQCVITTTDFGSAISAPIELTIRQLSDPACTPPPPPCPCDTDNDGQRTIADYFTYLTNFFAQLNGPGSADFDGDGTVTIADYFAFLNCLPAIAASEPCP